MSAKQHMMLAAAAAMLLAGCVTDEPEIQSLVGVGDRVPQFEVTMDDGEAVSDRSLAGDWYALLFFNTSCSDCRRELPRMEEFHTARPDVPLVCISREEDAASVAAYWHENSFTMSYSARPDATVYHRFATGGIPRLYVVDPSGTITALFSETDMPSPAVLSALIPQQ